MQARGTTPPWCIVAPSNAHVLVRCHFAQTGTRGRRTPRTRRCGSRCGPGAWHACCHVCFPLAIGSQGGSMGHSPGAAFNAGNAHAVRRLRNAGSPVTGLVRVCASNLPCQGSLEAPTMRCQACLTWPLPAAPVGRSWCCRRMCSFLFCNVPCRRTGTMTTSMMTSRSGSRRSWPNSSSSKARAHSGGRHSTHRQPGPHTAHANTQHTQHTPNQLPARQTIAMSH